MIDNPSVAVFRPLVNKLMAISWHPFVFAACAVVASLNEIKTGILWQECLPAFFMLETITLVVLVLGRLVLHDWHKAGLVAAAFVAWLLIYRVFDSLIVFLSQLLIGQAPFPLFSLILYCAFGLICLWALLKEKWTIARKSVTVSHDSATSSLNFVSMLMLILNVVPFVIFSVQLEQRVQLLRSELAATFKDVKLQAGGSLPDIYYIIPDGFANGRVRREYWRNSDSQFDESLRAKGFYTVKHAASNYDRTCLSVSSSLNMQYLNNLNDHLGENNDFQSVYERSVQHSCVVYLLKKLGYKFINISSSSGATDWMPDADLNLGGTLFNNYTIAFLQLTPLYAVEKHVHFLRNAYVRALLSPSRLLPQVVKMKGPKFVLLHTLISHPPYVLDADGNRLPLDPTLQNQSGTPVQYLSQLQFAEKLLSGWVDTILAADAPKPVIIVQSDHGPQFPLLPADYYNERMHILNSFFLPDATDLDLAVLASITPVNSFRFVFNKYYRANLPLLPNQSFCNRTAGPGSDLQLVRLRF